MIAGAPFSVLKRTIVLRIVCGANRVLTGLLLALTLTLPAGSARSAEPGAPRVDGACSADDARKAETAAVSPGTWEELHATFRRHAACDDGAAARGFSATVVRLLAGDRGALSKLVGLSLEDVAFRGFVVKHADESVNVPMVREALLHVRQGCPHHVGVCEDLEFMLEQSGAARGSRSAGGFRAMVRAAPGVVWSPPLLIDVDGDGVADDVALGRTGTQAVVAVTRAVAPATADLFRLPPATAPEGKGCGAPAAARLLVETPPPAEDADAPPAAKTPAATGSNPFRVDLGDCDAFHFFFDGKQIAAWRR